MNRTAFVTFAFVALVADAESMWTPLEAVLTRSSVVAIVRYVAPVEPLTATQYELKVERALRGRPDSVVRVKASPDGHAFFTGGERLVAFIDASDTWIAFAQLTAGPSIEEGVLRVSGFYDCNAHLVVPGILTLAQIELSLARGVPALEWTFRGKLWVGTKRGLSPSSIEVTAQVPSGNVVGMPTVVGFPAPRVELGGWKGQDVIITWDNDLGRPLSLHGELVGKNPDGTLAVEYQAYYPTLLSEGDFSDYVAGKVGRPSYELRLSIHGRAPQALTLEKEVASIGRVGAMPITELSLDPERIIKFSGAIVRLAAAKAKAKSHGATNELIEELMAGPIPCTYSARSGPTVPCELSYRATKFEERAVPPSVRRAREGTRAAKIEEEAPFRWGSDAIPPLRVIPLFREGEPLHCVMNDHRDIPCDIEVTADSRVFYRRQSSAQIGVLGPSLLLRRAATEPAVFSLDSTGNLMGPGLFRNPDSAQVLYCRLTAEPALHCHHEFRSSLRDRVWNEENCSGAFVARVKRGTITVAFPGYPDAAHSVAARIEPVPANNAAKALALFLYGMEVVDADANLHAPPAVDDLQAPEPSHSR